MEIQNVQSRENKGTQDEEKHNICWTPLYVKKHIMYGKIITEITTHLIKCLT
jgi:hypothetical protein